MTVSHLSPSQGLSTNTSAYARLSLALRCDMGFTVPAPKDTQSRLKQSLNTKPVLLAVHLVKHPAVAVKGPSVGSRGLTAGHGVGL